MGSALCFPHLHSLFSAGAPPAFCSPANCAGVRSCTSEAHNTHKTEQREVLYRWHPWHGQRVWIQGKGLRNGQIVLRCVRDELSRFPVLEIPAWMFDLCRCRRMQHNSQPHVSSSALLELKDLLSTTARSLASSLPGAQHLPSSSGDADAHIIMVPPTSGRVVFSTSEAAAAACGRATEDGSSAGADVERTSGQAASFTSGGGR